MPNIKSAKKRVNIIKTKTLQNNMIKSACKTTIKKFETAVTQNNKENANNLYKEAVKSVDQACSKGVIKKNTASRKKSKLTKLLNTVNA